MNSTTAVASCWSEALRPPITRKKTTRSLTGSLACRWPCRCCRIVVAIYWVTYATMVRIPTIPLFASIERGAAQFSYRRADIIGCFACKRPEWAVPAASQAPFPFSTKYCAGVPMWFRFSSRIFIGIAKLTPYPANRHISAFRFACSIKGASARFISDGTFATLNASRKYRGSRAATGERRESHQANSGAVARVILVAVSIMTGEAEAIMRQETLVEQTFGPLQGVKLSRPAESSRNRSRPSWQPNSELKSFR